LGRPRSPFEGGKISSAEFGELRLHDGGDWVQLEVWVQPRASRDQVDGVKDGALRVRLKAPPIEGKANRALQSFMAKLLGLAKGDVEIVAGATSRRKLLRIHGIGEGELAVLWEERAKRR